ncbi:MAG: DNA/RNA non-specific endonuclease [Nitrospira sp.]|nr:DNA/RNA non-specific endonuclease [Candidatus Manganitrophaceae bacterium]
MIHWLFTIFIIFVQIPGEAEAAPDLLKREYHGFTLWLDCEQHHGAVAFYYKVGADRGNISPKSARYKYDRKVPLKCQPQSWRSYRTTTVDPFFGTWDRGHLVSTNHMDNKKAALLDTFLLTNTLPQNSAFKQSKGAWHQTEIITECYRDITPLEVWGGVIWGNDTENDFFTGTHGIKTPDHWWKLIYRLDNKEYVAWVFPNRREATASDIDRFQLSLKDLLTWLDFIPDFGVIEDLDLDGRKLKPSWPVTQSGEKLTCEGKTTSSG